MAAAYVTGVEQALRATSKARTDAAGNVAEGLAKCGRIVLTKARYYAPLDKGPLRASGTVTVTGVGMAARVVVAFGGPDAPYALYVHEDLTKAHASPTCAKFLERAAREMRGTCTALMHRQVGGGGTLTKDGVAVD